MAETTVNLTASNLKYLLTVKKLLAQKPSIRCIDVAKTLSVARPSALRALENLQGLGIMSKGPCGSWSLTASGASLAERYEGYYQTVGSLFLRLLPPEADSPNVVYTVLSEVPLDQMDSVCSRILRESQRLVCTE